MDEMEELSLEDKASETENVVILGVCAMDKKVNKFLVFPRPCTGYYEGY